MVRINVVYEGDLHTECRHGPSGTKLATDAPRDNEGRGESYSPTDLVATALGSCMLTVMGILARRRGWALEGARAAVEKHMTAHPERRIGRLQVRISLPPGLPVEARAALERAALSCPVHRSLHPDVAVEVGFEVPDSG